MPLESWRKEIILRYLQKLSESFKPKLAVNPKPLRQMWQKQNHVGMVTLIRDSLNLQGLKIVLALVKSGGPKKASAWIERPVPTPYYGSKEFREMNVYLYIRNEYVKNESFEMVVKTFAHELSHIVLHSTHHPLKDSEEATDLVAMLLGYHEFYLRAFTGNGCLKNAATKRDGEDLWTYTKRAARGLVNFRAEVTIYLNTSEVCFAHEWIEARLQ